MTFRSMKIYLCVTAVFVSTSGQLELRAQAVTGSVLGRVTDQSGSAVASASVTLINLATNKNSKAATDSQGEYTFPDPVLRPASLEDSPARAGYGSHQRASPEAGCIS